MADSSIKVLQADGSQAIIDTRTESTNSDNRQVIVIGDPSSNNAVAAVKASDPNSNDEGIVVRDVNSTAIVSRLNSTLSVSLDPGHTLGSIQGINSSVAVYFDRANPSVTVSGNTNTLSIYIPDTGHTLGSIQGVNSSVAVYFDRGNPSISVSGNTTTLSIYIPDTGHELGSIKGVNSSVAVYFDRGNPSVTVSGNTNTLSIYIPDTGHEIGSIKGINSSVAVYFSPSNPIVNMSDMFGTAEVGNTGGTASGSANGVSVSGNTIVSPLSGHAVKVYAINLTTTAQSSITAKFTNGAGTGPTEYWRYALQAPTQGISGANIAVTPPGFIFATAAGSTLSLVLDSGSLVHYSVSYFKESA